MACLQLWFTDRRELELFRTSFSHSLLGDAEKICVRGKSAGPFEGSGTFSWTQGVQALCVVLLRAAATRDTATSCGMIQGQAGSLAASLDYAVCKLPVWLLDMFGVDMHGRALVSRLFHRSNSSQKRPGPVVVSLNTRFLLQDAIRVFVEGDEILDSEVLLSLAERIASMAAGRKAAVAVHKIVIPPAPKLPEMHDDNRKVRELLYGIYLTEAHETLLKTNIFDRKAYRLRMETLVDRSRRQKLDSRKIVFTNPHDEEILEQNPRGIIGDSTFIRRQLANGEPLNVFSSPNHAGALSIFAHLKTKGVPLELHHGFPHASALLYELVSQKLSPEPDLCILGFTQAAALLSQRKRLPYRILMFLPSARIRILALNGALQGRGALPSQRPEKARATLGRGRYGFLNDHPTACRSYFTELVHERAVSQQDVSVESLNPAEIFARFREGDEELRAISWFPYNRLNETINRALPIDDPSHPSSFGDIVLLAHDRILGDPQRARALNLVIRDAWLELLENPDSLKDATRSVLDNPQFLKVVFRTAGLTELLGSGLL